MLKLSHTTHSMELERGRCRGRGSEVGRVKEWSGREQGRRVSVLCGQKEWSVMGREQGRGGVVHLISSS